MQKPLFFVVPDGTFGLVEATGKGNLCSNRLVHQVGDTSHCNNTMVVTRTREATTSHIGNPSRYGNRHSLEMELPVPPPPSSMDQQEQSAVLVQQVQTLVAAV